LFSILLLVSKVEGRVPGFGRLAQVATAALRQKRGMNGMAASVAKTSQGTNEMPIVVLDFSGSTADDRCDAPVGPFVETYAAEGITITEEEARAPMGLAKDKHIAQIPVMSPSVAQEWERVHGRSINQEDVDRMFARFKPLQIQAVKDFSTLIEGARETHRALIKIGIEYIGGTTGFFKEAADAFRECVGEQGFHFSHIVCPDDVGGKGRPAADQETGGYGMVLENMKKAGVYDPRLVIKAGDTEGDIEEGRRIEEVYGTPTWTVGFYQKGNYWPFTDEQVAAMSPEEYAHNLLYAKYRLGRANFLIPSIAQLPGVVESIMELNRRGITPDQFNEIHSKQVQECPLWQR